ncbi:MAG: RNA pyrophosphohydrolase [Desulfosarcinaceae bacterium]|nr:RNA pyrophosphohydrolase [Desulfosarcinaceae bacterium]
MADWRFNPLQLKRFFKRTPMADQGASPPGEAFFRASVGAMVLDQKGRVLVLRRKDVARPTWQLPQGGLHWEESLEIALQRELAEETGLTPDDYAVLAEYPRWLAYELPAAFQSQRLGKGQVQRWFVCRLVDDLAKVRPDQVEFDAFKWVRLDEMVAHAVAFRRSIYEQLAAFAADIVDHATLMER